MAGRKDKLECEHCGAVVVGTMFDEYGIGMGVALMAAFCPSCGKRVRRSRGAALEMRKGVK